MIENRHLFQTVAKIYTGWGCLAGLGRETATLGDNCVLVTGRSSMRLSGILDRVLALLGSEGISVTLYEDVGQDPTVASVDAIRELAGRTAADVVIGLGGGSAMDAAKAAAALAREEAPTSDFLRTQAPCLPGIPFIAVATTSGTGAEVTPNAVITDPEVPLKASLRNGQYLARVAFVDPETTLPCPPRVTAYSGLDALTQAVESFVSIHATVLTDALAFQAFCLLNTNVEHAYLHGDDRQARTATAYGSLLSGMALANARLGAVHGIVHPLGARYGIPHGLACAALLPEVTELNLAFSSDKYAMLSAEVEGGLVDMLRGLNRRLGIYADFAKYPIPQQDFALIAEESMQSGSLKANPKKFSTRDVTTVLSAIAALLEK